MGAGLAFSSLTERGCLGAIVVVGDHHRRLELALVSEQRIHLGVDMSLLDALDMIGLLTLEQKKGSWTVVGQTIGHVLSVVVRITGGNHGIDGEETGVAMVGVHAPPAPGVVAEHDVGGGLTDHPGDPPPLLDRVGEFAVDFAEEVHLGVGVDTTGGLSLFGLPASDEDVGVGIDVPRSFGPVGADQEMDRSAGGAPLGKGAAALELDVVGMGV